MAEKIDAAKAAAAFNAMDHDLQARRSGNWLPPIPPVQPVDPAKFNAMDHAVQYGPEQAEPAVAPAIPQPEVSSQGPGEK